MADQMNKAAGQGQQPTQDPTGENQQQMSPQVQEQYDMFVVNAMEIVHDSKVTESFLGRVSQGGDPITTFAETAVDIVSRLAKSARDSGVELANEVLVHGGNAVLGEIITVAEAAGMEPLEDAEKEAAFQRASALFLDGGVKDGSITPEQLQELGGEFMDSPGGQQIASSIQGAAIATDVGPGQMSTPGQNPGPAPPQPQNRGLLSGGQR